MIPFNNQRSTAMGLVVLLLLICYPISVNSRSKKTENPTVLKVRQIYTSQIGIREQGYNAGKQVEIYLRYVNLPKGNPWCAAFVCWVLGRAGVENPKTGWSPSLFPLSKTIWIRGSKDSSRPSVGDIFGLYFPEKNRIAHVGFIDSWDGKWLITVEGNTNKSGSREGDGVYRKKRLVSSIYKVARYINLERREDL